MNLIDMTKVRVIETKRNATCKNCGVFETGPMFKKGDKRIQISNGFGNRHLTLCTECALHELKVLSETCEQLLSAINKLKPQKTLFTLDDVPF